MAYNPLTRTFNQLREVCVSELGLDPRRVRPSAKLASILPPFERRRVWQALKSRGLKPPELILPERVFAFYAVAAIAAAGQLSLWMWNPWCLATVVPLLFVADWASRPQAMHLPSCVSTIDELVMYMTNLREHRASGYRWGKREIAYKVRLIVADAYGCPLEKIRPETTFAELDG